MYYWYINEYSSINPRLKEDEDQYSFKVELPGVEKEDLKVSTEADTVSIYAERDNGSYDRTFSIPKGGDINGVKASYKNGVLTITIAKLEKAKARKVEIAG